MILFLQFKEARLWFFIRDQNFLPITDVSCSINGYVAIGVITHSLVQISPATFSHVVGWVKLLLKIAVDCTERVSLEIRCVVNQCLQYIRIACVKNSVLTNFIDVTCWAVFRSNKINCKMREPVKRLCFVFNGSLWIAKECRSWIWKPKRCFKCILFYLFVLLANVNAWNCWNPPLWQRYKAPK